MQAWRLAFLLKYNGILLEKVHSEQSASQISAEPHLSLYRVNALLAA